MTVSSANSVVGSSSTTPATKAATGLAGDFNTFLTLLTTQLQHQDPLDPMKSNEFTQQLVAFTGVEQQITANKNLESLIAAMRTQDSASTVGYLGKEVTVYSEKAMLADGNADWTYSLDTAAAKVNLTVKDSSGNTIYTQPGDIAAGSHQFKWNGKNIDGTDQPDGVYTLGVEALTADGASITNQIYQKGTVKSIDNSYGTSLLSVNGLLVPRENIVSIGVPASVTN